MPQAPEYISITTAAGQLAAVLAPEPDGITAEVEVQLNGQSQITVRVPADSAKATELQPERLILTEDREFAIFSPQNLETVRDGQKKWLQVTAPESWALLGKKYPTVGNDSEASPSWGVVSILASDLGRGRFPAGSAGSAIYRLLQGSTWTVGTVDVIGSHDLETERLSLLENIHQVQQTWGGYLVWDSRNHVVHLRDEAAWLPGTGVQIRYAKNLKSAERTVDSDLVTRLYPFGQDGLSIASVNGGQLYIEDHAYSPAVYEGIWERQDIDDPAELLAAAQKALPEISKPRVGYSVNLVDLSALEEYAHEEFALGDIVQIIDPELAIDAGARVVRHRYDVFQPWKATVELGRAQQTLASILAGASRAADFVQKVLRPNPGTGNLLRGVINTFATTINSASGKLIWSDDTLQAVEVDGSGAETGRRVRITPGGIGISTDGGATYATAMTGQGILANAVIVSDLYALATDDGYTKLSGDGLHVFDPANQERVHVGRWLVGAVEHYGMRIFSANGTTMLDDQGLMQTWQEGRTDNIDIGFPMLLSVYLPAETRLKKIALLRFRKQAFRAYETGAASGGGTTVSISANVTAQSSIQTTGPSSASTSGPSSTSTSGPSSTSTTAETLHEHIWGQASTGGIVGTADAHYHNIDLYNTFGNHPHSHSMDHTHPMNHTHPMDHTHTLAHTHDMSHSHAIGSHVHGVVYGIYTGPAPTTVQIGVKINGTDRTSALGGPFTSDQSGLNIAPYLVPGDWNTVELSANGLCRLDASVFLQVLMEV